MSESSGQINQYFDFHFSTNEDHFWFFTSMWSTNTIKTIILKFTVDYSIFITMPGLIFKCQIRSLVMKLLIDIRNCLMHLTQITFLFSILQCKLIKQEDGTFNPFVKQCSLHRYALFHSCLRYVCYYSLFIENLTWFSITKN